MHRVTAETRTVVQQVVDDTTAKAAIRKETEATRTPPHLGAAIWSTPADGPDEDDTAQVPGLGDPAPASDGCAKGRTAASSVTREGHHLGGGGLSWVCDIGPITA
jgi:hypothetical protein